MNKERIEKAEDISYNPSFLLSVFKETEKKVENVSKQVEEIKIDSFSKYNEALNLNETLFSLLDIFSSNKEKHFNIYNRVKESNHILLKKRLKFIKSKEIKNRDLRLACRYVLGNFIFANEDTIKLYNILFQNDVLRRNEKGEIFIIGLHYKVRDNTFNIDRRGVEHYIYENFCGFQAIKVTYSSFLSFIKNRIFEIPILENIYKEFRIGNRKGYIKEIYLTTKEFADASWKLTK